MAEKNGSTPVPLSKHGGVGPSQPEENPIQGEVQTSDVQKLLVTGTLTTICNNTRIILGIIVCKHWTDKYTMETGLKNIFYSDTKVSLDDLEPSSVDYHNQVFKLLEKFGNGNRDPGQFRGLMQHPFGKLSANSVVFVNADKPSVNREKEMGTNLMHQLLVKSDVSLETLQDIANKCHLTTREVGEDGEKEAISIHFLLQKIIEAERKAMETRTEEDEILRYIDAYQHLADAFLNNNLEGFYSLDAETRQCFQQVGTAYNEGTRLLQNSQERNSTSIQSTKTDGSSYPIDDKVLDAILVMLERGGIIAPQIVTEQIVGTAYAIHIYLLAMTDNDIKYHLPFNSIGNGEYYNAGVSLYDTLNDQYKNLHSYCTEMTDDWQCSHARKRKINSSINAIDKAITAFKKAKPKRTDRSSCIYESAVEEFKQMSEDKDGRYTLKGLNAMLGRFQYWMVAVIHELIVCMKITLGSYQLLDFITNASSKKTSTELKEQVASSKHHLEPLRDIGIHLQTLKNVFSKLYEQNPLVTQFITKELALETLEKYTEAFQTGWKEIQKHARDCPERDQELAQVKQKLEAVEKELADLKQQQREVKKGTKKK